MQIRRKPFLRQYAEKAVPVLTRLQEQLDELADAREANDEEATLPLLGEVGEGYRMLGRLDLARAPLEEAVQLADQRGDARRGMVNRLRLATLMQYAGEHEAAIAMFDDGVARARSLGLLVDFALQHRGKCLAELGRWEAAIADFEAALAGREKADDAALVASTREALELARERSGLAG